jgi:hypothetical protein
VAAKVKGSEYSWPIEFASAIPDLRIGGTLRMELISAGRYAVQTGNTTPVLSDREWALVIELLERERRELPAELHHTTTSSVREQLRARLAMIEDLLERLHEAGPKP